VLALLNRELRAAKKPQVQDYYERQISLVEERRKLSAFQDKHNFHSLHSAVSFQLDETNDDDAAASFAIRLSLGINCLLLVFKVAAYFRSGSLSVLASVVDSILDLCAGAVLVIAQYMASTHDQVQYPVGKRAFELLAILIFSSGMFVAASQVIQESVATMANIDSQKLDLDALTIAVLVGVIVVKVLMMQYCRKLQAVSDACRTLYEDHKNDVITNAVSIVSVTLAFYVWRYFDPIAGLLVTIYVMCIWARNAVESVIVLNGRSASQEYLNLVTYLAYRHASDQVLAVDTVRAVNFGGGYIVEVDILLPGTLPLKEAHDIGEALQLLLEKTPELNVNRANVHLDYETAHSPWDHR